MGKKPDVIFKWSTKTRKGVRFYFHRKAGNGEIVFSSQGYMSRSGRDRGVNRITAKENIVVKK